MSVSADSRPAAVGQIVSLVFLLRKHFLQGKRPTRIWEEFFQKLSYKAHVSKRHKS